MNPSENLKAFTKRSEGCVLRATWDVDGYSIGYGHHNPSILEGTVWTQQQADDQFEVDMAAVARAVSGMVAVPLTQGQFDCLCDFAYNEGPGKLKGSELLKALNLGRYEAVPAELYRRDPDGTEHGWILVRDEHGVRKVLPGLVARRQGELAFWNGNA